MYNKLLYLKTIKKENIKFIKKYKDYIEETKLLTLFLNNKIEKQKTELEFLMDNYQESSQLYHQICKNLL